jgi:hypothetical protein
MYVIALMCACTVLAVAAQPTLNPDYQNFINISSPHSAFAARDAHSSVMLNGRAYVCGGINRVTQMVFQDVWVSSSPNAGVWVPVAVVTPYPRRFDHAAAVVGNTLLVLGGDFYYGAVSSSRHDVWASSDNGINWVEQVQRAPWRPRKAFAVASVGTKLVLVGGLIWINETTPHVHSSDVVRRLSISWS